MVSRKVLGPDAQGKTLENVISRVANLSDFYPLYGLILIEIAFKRSGDAVNAGVDRKSGREEAEAYLGRAPGKFQSLCQFAPSW